MKVDDKGENFLPLLFLLYVCDGNEILRQIKICLSNPKSNMERTSKVLESGQFVNSKKVKACVMCCLLRYFGSW